MGYSGHGYSILDVALDNNFEILGYMDFNENNFNPYGLNYLGIENNLNNINKIPDSKFILGIGNNKKREEIFNFILKNKGQISNVISESSNISKTVKIGNGNFINKNVIINTFSLIEDNIILNTGCIIEHNCEIAKSSHIAPGVVLAGGVKIGSRTFIGANSVVKQGVKIGSDVVVGAGSVVLKDVPDGYVVVGNPARKI